MKARAFRFARSPKTATHLGEWKTAKMPKSAFPLSLSHSYILGATWTWRVVSLTDNDGRHWRLLVGFEAAKQQYRGWLGLVDGSDLALIARLEFHPGHHFWHCHVKTSALNRVTRGAVKEARAYERVLLCPGPKIFDVTESNAIGYAFRIFNVTVGRAGSLV